MMYKFEDATPEELEELRGFIDSQRELHYHVAADLEWWMTGEWKLNGDPLNFMSMEDMLSHFRSYLL